MKYSLITLRKKNIKDFAKERNMLLRQTKDNWVFFVDSDEMMSPKLNKEIGDLNPTVFNGFYVKRKNYFLGQYVGTDNIIRLGKKGGGNWTRGVHETWKIKGPIGLLNNCLIHNTASSLKDYVSKINFYSTLHSKENKKEGKSVSVAKIVVYPSLKFFVELAKSKNVVFSIMQSFHSFLSWSKQWESKNL